MNSSFVTPSTYPLTSAYTVLQSISEGSAPLGPTYKSSSSWRRFIHTSTQPGAVSAMTVVPAKSTTTKGPIVLKPIPEPEDADAQIEAFLRFLDYLESKTETVDDVTAEQ